MRFLLILCLTLIVSVAHSQSSSRKKKKSSEASTNRTETSLEPSYQQNNYQPSKKSSKRKDEGPTYDSEKEYYARLEEIQKTRRKNEKLMEKPQYADPSYFGHKRPPKKRSVKKMKFCKECGIRH